MIAKTLRRSPWVLVVGMVLGVVGSAGPDLANAGASDTRPRGQDVFVRRTAHGIPHILAGDYRGLGFGAGYAFAEDNLCLLADTVVTLSAQRSRWFDPEELAPSGVSNLDSDLYQQSLNQSGAVERLLAEPPPVGPSRQARELLRGYAAGYNRYLAETTVAGLPDRACQGAPWVRPITERALWRRAYQFTTVGDEFQEVFVPAQPPGAPPARPPATSTSVDRLSQLLLHEDVGSNSYALGRQATRDGTGMVLANPHSPWLGDQRYYQLQLTIPGELNVSGISLPGIPVVGIGHNARLAWTHTASTAHPLTVTRLTLAAGDPHRYLVDGEVRPIESDQVTVTVRQPDGQLVPVTRTVYRTPDGPLVEVPGALDWTTTTAYATRDPNATNLRVIDQWLAMGRAGTVRALHTAQARLLGLPWFNTLAADRTGTAYFGDVQVVPHVIDEQLADCATGPDIGLIVLDGSRSACDSGSDPDALLPGMLGPSRLPTLFREDHVSNMNNSPWLTNPAAPLTGYPAVVGDIGTERSPRTRMGLDMIADRLDGSDGLGPAGFTLRSLQATMFGNRNLTAEQGRAETVAMCEANPTLTASDGRPVDVRAACAALAGWDGRGDLDARGAILWRKFMERAGEDGVDVWRVPFDPADPTRTPRGFDAGRMPVRQAFADAVQEFHDAGVPVDVELGEFQRYAGVPIHGCSSFAEGCFNQITVDTTLDPDGPVADVSHGSTFIMAVELTRSGPRARTILTYGQSVNPASPYYTDQTTLYSAKQWITGRFTEAEIARDPALTVRRLTW